MSVIHQLSLSRKGACLLRFFCIQPLPQAYYLNICELPLDDIELIDVAYAELLPAWEMWKISFQSMAEHFVKCPLLCLLNEVWIESLEKLINKVELTDFEEYIDHIWVNRFLYQAQADENAARQMANEIAKLLLMKQWESGLVLSEKLDDYFQIIWLSENLYVIAVENACLVASLCHLQCHSFEQAIQKLNRMQILIKNRGDTYHLILCLLEKGRIYVDMGQKRYSVDAFKEAFLLLDDFGNQHLDILANLYKVYYYAELGRVKDVVKNCELALYAMDVSDMPVYDTSAPILLALNVLYSGDYERSIRILQNHISQSKIRADINATFYYVIYLSLIFAIIGDIEKAKKYILEAPCYDNVKNTYYLGLYQRVYSYIMFKCGDVLESYNLFIKSMKLMNTAGITEYQNTLPWFFEYLYGFRNVNLEEFNGSFVEKEMSYVLQGDNIHAQGVVYRLLAKEEAHRGTAVSEVFKLLYKSKQLLIDAGSVLELTKTELELAVLEFTQGSTEKAVEIIRTLNLNPLSAYSDFIPQHLHNFFLNISTEKLVMQAQETVYNLFDLIELKSRLSRDEDFFQELCTWVAHFFHAASCCLFVENDSVMTLLSSFGIKTGKNKSEYDIILLEKINKIFNDKQREDILVPVFFNTLTEDFNEISGYYFICYHSNMPYLVFFIDSLSSLLDLNMYDSRLSTRLSTVISLLVWEWKQESIRKKQKSLLCESHASYELLVDSIPLDSPNYQKILSKVDILAESDVSVMILGETGVGKDVMARRIHALSKRRAMPFIAVNLASIPETLLASELFGHEKGAFTGADRKKLGLMELAHKGTLFIDEIGEIPQDMQVKLLRALEEKSITHLGGVVRQATDFRLITATNRNILKEIAEGRFREDLYYRLCVVPLEIPPLRERPEDIIKLTQYLIRVFSEKYEKEEYLLSSVDIEKLINYPWRGNIRELKNVIERSVLFSEKEIFHLDISEKYFLDIHKRENVKEQEIIPSELFSYEQQTLPSLEELEKQYIQFILNKTQKKISGLEGASEILGMNRTTLYSRMKKLGIQL